MTCSLMRFLIKCYLLQNQPRLLDKELVCFPKHGSHYIFPVLRQMVHLNSSGSIMAANAYMADTDEGFSVL